MLFNFLFYYYGIQYTLGTLKWHWLVTLRIIFTSDILQRLTLNNSVYQIIPDKIALVTFYTQFILSWARSSMFRSQTIIFLSLQNCSFLWNSVYLQSLTFYQRHFLHVHPTLNDDKFAAIVIAAIVVVVLLLCKNGTFWC